MINEQGHIVLDANGGKVLTTIKQIDSEARSLKATLRSLEINSDQFKKTSAAINELNKEKTRLNQTLSGTNKLWENIKTQMISVGAVALGFLGFQVITGQIGNMIRKNAELSDSLATIRQKTGMTQEEVQRLNAEFGKFDTRTATKELRSIATELGQLGINKDKIADTTKAVDKLSVALEGEFSNAAEVTRVTGTLRNILTDIRTDAPDQDMLHLGNALLELGNAGLATAPVVSDIATRIGAVGGAMGMTAGQVLGISASLQELGLTAERGGTAVAKILMKMTGHVTEFAQIAGVPVADFTNMLNTDLYEAFKKVMTGSQKSAESATVLATMLKDAELSGAGASEVFLKLGKNAGMMDEKVSLASKALGETNKIMDSFALKNETFGAKLEKIGKIFYGWMANSALSKGFEAIADGILSIANNTDKASKAVTDFNKANDEYENTSKKMIPLLARYDELQFKGERTADEQKELDKIIKEIAKQMPDSVAAFGELGGAMEIDTAKARGLIEHMRRVKEIMNETVIAEKQKERNELMVKQIALGKAYQEQLIMLKTLEGKDESYFRIYFDSDKATALKKHDAELVKMKGDWEAMNDKVKSYNETINELKGIQPEIKKENTAQKTGGTLTTTISPEELDKAKKALEDYIKDTAKLTEQLRTAQAQSIDDETQREVQLAKVKYENNLDELKQYEATIIAKRSAGIKLTAEEEKREVVLQELKIQILEEYQRKAKDVIDNFNKKIAADEFKATIDTLQNTQTIRRNELKKQYESGNIDEKTYNDKLAALKILELTEEKTAYQDYGKDVTDIDEKITDTKIANAKKVSAAIKKESKDAEVEWKKFLAETEKELQKWSTSSVSIINSFNDIAKSKDEERFRDNKKLNEKQINDARANSNQQILMAEQEYKKGAISKEKYDEIKATSEQQLNDKITLLNAQLEGEQRRIAYEQAKRDKDAAEFNAAIQGALAIVKAWATGGPILAAFTAAAVALEIRAIEQKPLPEYAIGGKTKVEGKSGQSYDTQYVGSIAGGGAYNNPSLGILSEKGPEYVIPNWIYTMPEMANVIGMLEAVRVRGYVNGGSTGKAVVDNGQVTVDNEIQRMTMQVMVKLMERLDKPIDARLSYDELSYDLKRIEGALDTGKLRST